MKRSRRLTIAVAIAGAAALGTSLGIAESSAPGSAPSVAATVLTPEQRQALRTELARFLRQDADGLVSRARADGATLVELDGRYQHAIVARPAGAGRPELACFDDPDAAVAFIGRDEQRAGPATPNPRKPAPAERNR